MNIDKLPPVRRRGSLIAEVTQREAEPDPTPAPAPVIARPPTPVPQVVAPTPTPEPAPAPVAPAKRTQPHPVTRAGKKQTNVPMPADLRARMEAAAAHTLPHTGLNSMTRFMIVAAEELCERLEEEFNGGRRFDPPAFPAWTVGAPPTRTD